MLKENPITLIAIGIDDAIAWQHDNPKWHRHL